ncbi:MotA/TolQ/ExbB proton channel family protein [Acinetobacter sp. MD2(2019)]|uniref:MotA/TolQ/ExbB proton channel family protein n=1 Tax=Acinetobacter sp. MD2(2019) TaxID=2605273 RepID=UPI002D1ECB8F|nr:MotA/TolQ/ExbB proton channel family protein [Acinetobacter sp. MD2(2019)]MEB3752838.1 MotA/TolQ/ExbB proton channel family protein [Acinetobacter sp. MD2(2019)]
MWELFKAGGWLMLPLLLCSVFTVAITLERLIRLRRKDVLPKQILVSSRQGNLTEIIEQLQHDSKVKHSALGQILSIALQSKSEGEQFTRAQMEVVASQEIHYLEKNINFLGTISAVAPLLGLLGTVVGIIESFLMIDVGSNVSPTLMIPGISKALIATAMGMVVAIPALIAYRYLQRVVHEYISELEQQATLFHAQLFYQQRADQSD